MVKDVIYWLFLFPLMAGLFIFVMYAILYPFFVLKDWWQQRGR